MEQKSKDQNPEGSKSVAPKPKKEKVPVDPAQRERGGFDRSILKGKDTIFRKQKKSGR